MIDIVVTVVIGSYNRKRFLRAVLNSVRNNGITVPCEIIVVDGGSTDGTLNYLLKQKDVITIIQHNRGTWKGMQIPSRSWGYFMNLGFKIAKGKFICMLSDDALIVPSSISAGIEAYYQAEDLGKRVGAVAFYWREWPELQEYHVGITFGGNVFVNHGLYLRKAVEEAGWIDEENYHFYHADGDLCLRMKELDYETIDCRKAFVEHFTHTQSKNRTKQMEKLDEDWKFYQARWGYLDNDSEPRSQNKLLSYEDTKKTANHFPRYDTYRYLVRKRLVQFYKSQFQQPRAAQD